MMRALAVIVALATSYEAEIAAWRAQREAELRADDGWLTVAGLFWLADGASRFGTAPDNEIVLPEGSAPDHAGVVEHHAGRTLARVADGPTQELRADSPDVLVLGRLSLLVIERGGRFALRVRDRESPQRKRFTGLSWYPIRPRLRVTARFVAAPAPRTLRIANVVGQIVDMPSPGRARFTIGGTELALDAVLEEPGAKQLFFIFADGTSGDGSYPAGRFLYTDLPEGGIVVLDFNKAHSPPCAYTAFATCPLPPRQNRLPVRIEAGERY
jgi:uncharacterized protein (DUF1684 family)